MPFQGTATVVESRRFRHPVSGRTFSVFSSWIEPGSELETVGYTISWSGDGTVGTCRPAWVHQAQAQEWADAWNSGCRSVDQGLPLMPGMAGFVHWERADVVPA